ncbi:MAG: DegQ family serine endoprotease [Proteobacteria bacterium]|nr:DegQ family serine endoprotease [Pseudomonadota bacterium]
MKSATAWILAAGIAAAAALVLQPFGLSVELNSNDASARVLGQPFWSEQTATETGAGPQAFADLAEALSPSVVHIEVEQVETRERGPSFEFFGPWPFGPQQSPRGRPVRAAGSGFVISEDGFIVTNNHVVERAEEVKVSLRDGRELPAEIVGTDPKTDLALLKVEADDLSVAALGDSDSLRVGEWVVAIGNPLGLDHTVTVGILSAKGRKQIGPERIVSQYDDFLQTDASINPGNSGGPLIDMQGRVVGINTAIVNPMKASGIGFAIPINLAKELLPQLRDRGHVTRGWLGVSIQKVEPEFAENFGLEEPRGALVSEVHENSPAERAELETGDVILEFGNQKIQDVDDLPRIVAATPPGTEVDMRVFRDGRIENLTAVLEKMDEEGTVVRPAFQESPTREWGFEAQPLTGELAERLRIEENIEGMVVSGVEPGSDAAEKGLRRGDVILEVNRSEVSSPRELTRALSEADEHAVLLIYSGGSTRYIAIRKADS